MVQSKTLTEQLLPCLRPGYNSGQSDSAFRLLEYFEARIVGMPWKRLLRDTRRNPWCGCMTDGFLIAPRLLNT